MKSHKLAFNYFLTVLLILVLIFITTYLFSDLSKGNKLDSTSEAVKTIKNPLYIIWLALSFIFYIISRFIKNEKRILVFNKVVIFTPVILLFVFYFINIFFR